MKMVASGEPFRNSSYSFIVERLSNKSSSFVLRFGAQPPRGQKIWETDKSVLLQAVLPRPTVKTVG